MALPLPALLPLACYGAALLLTLMLAARLTPHAWWRRANLRALAVLVLGTGILGSALWWLAAPPRQTPVLAVAGSLDAPLPGRSYRVADALNLRAANGVGARRVMTLPAGAIVTATGVRQGDWWQVRTRVGGEAFEGWASSLWLRREDEDEQR
jgi:hypothetical protein